MPYHSLGSYNSVSNSDDERGCGITYIGLRKVVKSLLVSSVGFL